MILFLSCFLRAYHAGLIILPNAHLGSSVLGVFDNFTFKSPPLLAGEV